MIGGEKLKKHAIPIIILFFVALALCGSASADSESETTISSQSDMNTTDLPSNRHIFINVSNDGGVKYNNDSAYYVGPNGTYYIKADGGGLNELHVSNSSATTYAYGQVTVVNSTSVSPSGVFYLTNTGGRGFTDNIILLLSVKGPISDDFSVTIISNGYTWTLPVVAGAYQPAAPTDYHYITGVNETFTKSDFQYGPQIYKPGPGALGVWSLPLYYGQNTSESSTEEYLMFIDLYVGNIKSSSVPGLIDNGAVKVQYVFNNLTTTASFNMYGWTLASNQGEGISWTNKVVLGDTQSSGYTVNYSPVTPVADFSANTTSGNAPLNVQFTDTSSNYPTSWIWDFGDSTTSTEQNPTHTYTKPGNYTVTLTAINAAGNSTKTLNITAIDVIPPTVTIEPIGGLFNTTQTVTLNTTDDSGNATTYYTTDGSDPTTSSTRTVYNGPITINTTTTLKYAAIDPTNNWSPIYNQTYQIKSDVYVNITPSITNPTVGDKVTYTFKLGNNGPGDASNIVFTYVIPEGVEYAGANVDQGTVNYDPTTRTLTWNVGNVTAGTDPYLWLNLNILNPGTFTIQPTVTVEGYNPGLNNNIETLQVNAAPKTSTANTGSPTNTETVNAATTTQTIPMKTTGIPITALISALIMIGSGLALSRKN
ncbi:MAG: PKD domain-containing protein [Methanobacterium formicicum]